MKKNLKKLAQNFPESSGVYFFKKNKEFLYIGKATSLKNRTLSYFSKELYQKRGPLLEKMMEEVNDLVFEKTDSVLEALILEANLIKKHQPKYNTKEKSDKSFCYLIISDEEYPRIFIKRHKDLMEKKIKEKIKYSFGPYTSRKNLEEALKIIRKIFPFFSQKKTIAEKTPFYKQLGLAPNLGISKKEYGKNILNIKYFFEGKKEKILKSLEKKMKEFSKKEEFEKAAEIRNKINSLKHIKDSSLIFAEEKEKKGMEDFRIEAYDISHTAGKEIVGAFSVVFSGEALKSEYRKFKIKEFQNSNDTGALREILERRFSHFEWKFPDLIVSDGGVAQKRVVEKFLKENKLENIKVVSCLKNKKHKVEKILGERKIIEKYKKEILLANSEVHRFALSYHKKLRGKNFLGK